MLLRVSSRRRLLRLAFVLTAAASLHGQPATQPVQERVFSFDATSDAEFTAVTKAFSAITNLQPAANPAVRTIAVRGTPAELALADWLADRMAKPGGFNQPVARYDYDTAPDGATAARFLYFPAGATAQQINQTTNIVRTLSGINRMWVLSGRGIILRAKPAEADLAEWTVNTIGKPRDQAGSASYFYAAGGKETAVRAFWLPRLTSAQSVQELTNAVRTLTQINRMMPLIDPSWLCVRTTPERADLAQWLVEELGDPGADAKRAAPRVSVYEFNNPDRVIAPSVAESSAVRIFRLRSGTDSANLGRVVTAIRAETRVNNIFPLTANSAIAMLGTPLQASQAERIVEEWNQLPQSPASANSNQKDARNPSLAR
jgi:hypothetical protein